MLFNVLWMYKTVFDWSGTQPLDSLHSIALFFALVPHDYLENGAIEGECGSYCCAVECVFLRYSFA